MKGSIRKIERIYIVGSRGNFRSVGVTLPPEFGYKVGDAVQFSEIIDGRGRTVGGQLRKVEKRLYKPGEK